MKWSIILPGRSQQRSRFFRLESGNLHLQGGGGTGRASFFHFNSFKVVGWLNWMKFGFFVAGHRGDRYQLSARLRTRNVGLQQRRQSRLRFRQGAGQSKSAVRLNLKELSEIFHLFRRIVLHFHLLNGGNASKLSHFGQPVISRCLTKRRKISAE